MTNQFSTLFGVRHPIVLAPMAGAVYADLVAAVSNAGGLGLAPLWDVEVSELRRSIKEVRSKTDAAFGVNLCLDFPMEEHLDACVEEGVPVISFFWRQPEHLVARAQSGGAKVIFTAWSADSAKAAVDLGVDAICAQGWEAGGHVRGDVSTMALVPAVVDAVGDVPVIAAGGISDGRGLAAALALGASAAWIGTRFLAAEEASIHPDYLACLIEATEQDTAHFDNLFDIGWPDAPHRVLKNGTTRIWKEAGQALAGARPGEGDILGHDAKGEAILRYQSVTPGAGLTGSIQDLPMWSGQGVRMVRRVQPVADIIDEILRDAKNIIPF